MQPIKSLCPKGFGKKDRCAGPKRATENCPPPSPAPEKVSPPRRPPMSKHVSRKQRWTQVSPAEHTSALGRVVYRQRAWYGILSYRTRLPDAASVAAWESHRQTLGPFNRPRNAMIAVE